MQKPSWSCLVRVEHGSCCESTKTRERLACVAIILSAALGSCSPTTRDSQRKINAGRASFDVVYGPITGVVVTSVSEDENRVLRGNEGVLDLFVPSLEQIGIGERLLHDLHLKVSQEGATFLPENRQFFFQTAPEIVEQWQEFLRSYIGYRENGKEYLLLHFCHPSEARVLMREHGSKDAWKQVLGRVYSGTMSPEDSWAATVNLSDQTIVGLGADAGGSKAEERRPSDPVGYLDAQ